jgi:hypothetical protein
VRAFFFEPDSSGPERGSRAKKPTYALTLDNPAI